MPRVHLVRVDGEGTFRNACRQERANGVALLFAIVPVPVRRLRQNIVALLQGAFQAPSGTCPCTVQGQHLTSYLPCVHLFPIPPSSP